MLKNVVAGATLVVVVRSVTVLKATDVTVRSVTAVEVAVMVVGRVLVVYSV